VDTIGERGTIDERELSTLDAMLSHSPLVLVVFDPEYRISYWSKRASEALGYEAAEVLGKRLDETELVHGDDLANVLAIQLRSRTERTEAVVSRNVRRDGAVRTFRWSTIAAQRHPRFAAIVVGEDISATVDAATALVESEQRFRALFEFIPKQSSSSILRARSSTSTRRSVTLASM